MAKYSVETKDGKTTVIETAKKNITGIIAFKNDSSSDWGFSITSAKNPQAFLNNQKNITGRDWLSEWHMTKFKEIS